MDRVFRQFSSHQEAEQASREDDNLLSCHQRFEAFMRIMAPHYAAASRLQRVYRIDELRRRTVRDDWGIRLGCQKFALDTKN